MPIQKGREMVVSLSTPRRAHIYVPRHDPDGGAINIILRINLLRIIVGLCSVVTYFWITYYLIALQFISDKCDYI